MDRGAWWATAHGSQGTRHERVTENEGTVINKVLIVSGGEQRDPDTDTRIHSP